MRTVIRLILLFCPATMLYAQTPTQQQKFALEISEDGPPLHYELVPQGGESLSFAPSPYLHFRSGRTTADAKKNLASALMLAYHVDGDAVAITASVVFGAFDNNSGLDPMKADHPKQDIGTYSLHLNESVVLQEMEQFGLQPWTIKIVNAQLPTSAGPPTINEVPSIQNLPGRLALSGPNQLWAADITYIRLAHEFVYLAVVLDIFSRKVIGWALDRRLTAQLPLSALDQAIAHRKPLPGVVHHSDKVFSTLAERTWKDSGRTTCYRA
jgi:hypothetical protein